MIELKFYRDDEYVYLNNPDGTTKRVAIEVFENTFNVDTSELPAYTSSDAGKVLAVNSGGTGVEWSEGGGGGLTPLIVNCIITQDHGFDVYTLDKSWKEINDAYLSTNVIVKLDTYNYCVVNCGYYASGGPQGGPHYDVSFGTGNDAFTLLSTTENGYPSYMAK